jgi:hypothetical protein
MAKLTLQETAALRELLLARTVRLTIARRYISEAQDPALRSLLEEEANQTTHTIKRMLDYLAIAAFSP